ncbi:hypothetical protein L1987_05076 [Smallanthus sonchifolius]|uniref:Uncharacterized protein n=1 Tax=Smallanthus sonchifolius TaxID=185202 RepID=A0ACB9JUC5_9ASTR|nr:hypothetical protein L1987_05076 [Smallanthus sonchifolius]
MARRQHCSGCDEVETSANFLDLALLEVEIKYLLMADQHSDEGVSTDNVAGVANQHSDEGVGIADVALESLKSKGGADKLSDGGETLAEVAVDADKGDRIAEVALESLKSKGDSDKHIDEDETIAKVALVADKHIDKGDRIAEVALESMKSESVADKHSDEGESIAEVALEALKSKGVADQRSDEGETATNSTVKNSESMASGSTVEINIKMLDSQLHNFIVDKNMPVSTFKANIASVVGLPVEQQRLIFRGKVLKDEDLLSEYHVESGHTLHLVDRQPSEAQISSGSPNVETIARSSNAGQDDNVTGTYPRVGHVSHSVVLGTFGVGDQDEGSSPDVNQVLPSAKLLSIKRALFSIPVQVAHGNETGNQSQPSQSMPQGYQIPVPAVPTLATPIPESLHTISDFMNHMDRALSQNGDSAEGFPSVELPSNASGLPSLAALAVVMRHAQPRRLEEEGGSNDVTLRTQIQTEAMQSGLAMQHLGALLLELGRTMLTLRIGQSPVLDPRATNVESNQGEHANINAGVGSQIRGVGDNMRSENQSSVGQAEAGLPEVRTDAGGTGNATSSSTRMKSLSETEGGSSSSRRNIPLGLGPGGLQPKRRHRQTRSDASGSGSGVSTTCANQNLPSAGSQLDPATIMNQVVQNPALNNLLAGVSNQNEAGSQDFFRNLMSQLAQNPEMMNTVNQVAQQMDGNQDLTSMLAGMGGSGGGGGNLDRSSLVQQMMPFVSQALNSGSSSSSSKSLQSVPSRKGSLHRRLSSVKSLNTNERSNDFQMNLENTAQKIMEHYPPVEIFSSIIQTVVASRNNVYDTSAINELCMEEELAQEFTEMLKRDISRRLQ